MGEPKPPRRNRSINFRLHTLASSLFKGATQYYGAHFGIGLPEMRVLSNLGSEGPLAAYQIADLVSKFIAVLLLPVTRKTFSGSVAYVETDPDRIAEVASDAVEFDKLPGAWRSASCSLI